MGRSDVSEREHIPDVRIESQAHAGFPISPFHDPTSHDTQMPQTGEACKVSFVDTGTDDVFSDSVNNLTAYRSIRSTTQDGPGVGYSHATATEPKKHAEGATAHFMISDTDTVPEVMAVTYKTSLRKSDDLESESVKADIFCMMPWRKHSETCKVSFVDANVDDVAAQNINDPPALTIGEQRAVCHANHQAMIEAQGDENPAAINFAAEPYLQHPLTEDELAVLINMLHNNGIEDDETYDQLLDMEALLRLPAGYVPQDNYDTEVWFSAVRIGLQIPHIDSKYNVFAHVIPRDQEETQAFFDRLTRCDNAQSIRMKMDVSMKPIKAESLAVNALKNPASANPPPCDRAIAAYQHIVDFTPLAGPVDLAGDLPGVHSILAGSRPRFLMGVYENMNKNEMGGTGERNLRDVIV
ncbi:hypothetical protein NW768_006548 [Fusarium equiseti]|uniref:Uncharacterized protein n=1 Tax=Fusarium equiseti TaxID=61235 RepID=A0ABQ8RBW4_FUSEQ|nr:hypothetical protein NW768_006548 [Fusarium equiseti]